MRVNNCCAEEMTRRALEYFFPGRGFCFNLNNTANNNDQADIGCVFRDIPGQHIEFYDMSNRTAINELFGSLDFNKIYCVRSGENSGLGHFSFLKYNGSKWIHYASSLPSILSDSEGRLTMQANYFYIRDQRRCGPGTNQMSIHIDELNPPRTVALMNFLSIWRRQTHENTHESILEFSNTIITNNLHLDLHQNNINYWTMSEPNTPLLTDENNELTKSILAHMIYAQNHTNYIEQWLNLNNQNINTPVDNDGNTLLHLAVKNNSLGACQELIRLGADINLANTAGLSLPNILHQATENTDNNLRMTGRYNDDQENSTFIYQGMINLIGEPITINPAIQLESDIPQNYKNACTTYLHHLKQQKRDLYPCSRLLQQKITIIEAANKANTLDEFRTKLTDGRSILSTRRDSEFIFFIKALGVLGATIFGFGIGGYFAYQSFFGKNATQGKQLLNLVLDEMNNLNLNNQ